MAELIDIRRVQIGPETMIAQVSLADDCPLMTSEDIEGTARVYQVMPHIADHACVGDKGTTFREAMGDTEIAHLLEHVTVELLAQSDLAGDMPAGRTWVDEVDDRTYQIELACADDVLTAAALSCGVWILDWAYTGGGEPEPDVSAIVEGLVQMIDEIGDEGEDLVIDDGGPVFEDEDESEEFDDYDDYEGDEFDEDDEPEAEDEPMEPEADDEPVESAEEPEPEEDALEPEPEPVRDLWTPAPEVPTTRTMSRAQRESQMEAQIDQIMGSFGSDASAADAASAPHPGVRTVFDDVDIPSLAVIDEADAAVPEPDPVFEPEPDEAPEEPEGEQIPGPRLVR